MVEVRINANVRTGKTSSYKHHLRAAGKIPAVIYGTGISSEPIELDARELESVIHKKGRNALIDLSLKGRQGNNKKYVVMVKDVQRDPIRRDIVHADLCKISMNDKVNTVVPVVPKGDAKGLKMGGIVQSELREIDIECLPGKIPEAFVVDISDLEIGDHLSVGQLPTSPDYTILSDPDAIVVTIVAPRMAEQAETVAAGGGEVADKPNGEAKNS